MFKENKDRTITILRNEVNRLNDENEQLKNKIEKLESMTNIELSKEIESTNKKLLNKIEETEKLRIQYEKLVSLQDEYLKLLKTKYKKETNKAIKGFKNSLK